jgi:copper chaperone CopZ
MSKTIPALLAAIVLATAAAAGPEPNRPNTTQHFAIEGMTCGGCAAGLQFELEDAKGVFKAQVVFDRKLAVVSFDTNVITLAGVTNVIKQAGFKSRLLKTAKPK